MPTPFPGVDPYLESQRYWPDFHATFVNYWREAVSDALPGEYEARINEWVQIIGIESRESRLYSPDVAVVQGEGRRESGALPARNEATAGAVTLDIPATEEVRETLVEILHRPERSLVAVLELLSPTNKTGEGRGQYLAKRVELFTQPVHIVELDLLLGGERLPMRQALPPGDFYAIVSRYERRRRGDVYAWAIRDRLPAIPIPLLKPDKDIVIDLGAVFATAYERGRYAKSINYGAPLTVPLEAGSKQWAQELAKPK